MSSKENEMVMTGLEDKTGEKREIKSLEQDVADDMVGNYVMAPDPNVEEISREFQILLGQNKLDAALSVLINSPQTNLQHPMITFQLGYVLSLKNRLDEAQDYLEKTLRVAPDMPGVLEVLIPILNKLEKTERVDHLLKTTMLSKPENSSLIITYADLLYSKQLLEIAVTQYRRALCINPNELRAHANIAESLAELQRNDEALVYIDRAISRNPRSQQLRLNKAFTLLLLKKYKEGWQAYEARLSQEIDEAPKRLINVPRWKHEPLKDKSILVCSEQGVGDEILFSAYVTKLARIAKHVIIETDPRLVPLFSRSFKNLEVHPYSRRVSGTQPVYNYHWLKKCKVYPDLFVDLASLPYFLKETHQKLLSTTPHLKGDINVTRAWEGRLKKMSGGKPILGLFWRSGLYTGARKHFYPTIHHWGPILTIKDVAFLSLQFDDDSHDILLARQLFGAEILKPEGINLREDLDQTASLCMALAGVIAPSTTTAHLSGSVGTKTIIMDRTTTWSPMINDNQDAVIPSIRRIFPPNVDDWKWNFEKARLVVKGWLKG